MKRLSTALLAAFLILPLATTSFAQTTAERGITFAIGAPQGDFADQTDATGAGGHLFGALGFAGSPIKVGIDVGYLIYGHERRSEPFSTTIPDVTVDVTTDNNLVNGHLFLRFQPAKTTVRPYADAALASCTNRAFAPSSAFMCGGRNFNATVRSKRVSVAL